MKRRLLLKAGLQACAIGAGRAAWAQSALRFGTTAVFLDEQAGFLDRWASYLTRAVGQPVQFVQRRSYRDIMALLRAGQLEAAWICGYPWVMNKAVLRGLSIPLYHNEPLYQSYLIVPARDDTTRSIVDLRGKVYAFSDPDSNSGLLVPRTTLMRAGVDPDRHFAKSFFTWGHRNVVSAVAAGLADGGSVDGYVWDTLQKVSPELVAKTRVAWRSARYGFPPVVVPAALNGETERRLGAALSGMSHDAAGQRLLRELNLTGFGAFRPEVFDGIAQLAVMNGARVT